MTYYNEIYKQTYVKARSSGNLNVYFNSGSILSICKTERDLKNVDTMGKLHCNFKVFTLLNILWIYLVFSFCSGFSLFALSKK